MIWNAKNIFDFSNLIKALKKKKRFFWLYFDLKPISKNKTQNFRIHFLILNQKINFRKFFHFEILLMKLKNEKWKIFKICFVFKSKNELYFRWTDFLCISILIKNWKKTIFNFLIYIGKLKNKIFVFRFSIFILFQNTKQPLIKLTIVQVNPLM